MTTSIVFCLLLTPFAAAPTDDSVAVQAPSSTRNRAVPSQDAEDDLLARLQTLRQQMKSVGEDLAKRDASERLEFRQKYIVDELKGITDSISSGQNPADSSTGAAAGKVGSHQPSSATSPGSRAGGPGNETELLDPKRREQLIQQVWGELPAELGIGSLGGRQPTFLPKYERMIERYFRRMAKQSANSK